MDLLRKQNSKNLKIQKRDLDILRLCLEMKFSDIETINEMYFDQASVDMYGARKRIQSLESGHYLKSAMLLIGTTKKFYFATKKGKLELQKNITDEIFPDIVTKLSVVTFEHDYGVLKIRKLLEKQKRASNWKSEKLLKAIAAETTENLKRYFLPDALFTSKQQKVIALEFENKPKNSSQLKEKIFRLNAIMQSPDAPFEACLFVTSTLSLRAKVQAITDIVPGRFIVQSLSELEEVKT